MRLRRLGILVVAEFLALAAVTSLNAQADSLRVTVDPEKAAAIRSLLEITEVANAVLFGMEEGMAIEKEASPELPEEFWEEFEKRARADMGRFTEMLLPIWDENFTLDELQQLIEFYRTPVGQHVIQVQPLMTQGIMKVSEQWGMIIAAEVMLELAKKGVVVP